jgi:hypothetical protein
MNALNKQVGGNHYKDMKIQPLEFAELSGLSPAQAKTIKYLSRFLNKNGIQDIDKAAHCYEIFVDLYEQSKQKWFIEVWKICSKWLDDPRAWTPKYSEQEYIEQFECEIQRYLIALVLQVPTPATLVSFQGSIEKLKAKHYGCECKNYDLAA